MDVLPMGDGGVSLMDALASLDREKIRLALMSSILVDVLEQAGEISNRAGVSLLELGLYRNALQTWQSHCVHQALKRFPMDIVLKRFVEIWHQTDPSHIRWMRKAGNIIDLPIRAAVKTVKWIRGREPLPPGPEENSQDRYSEETMDDLLTAANDLWRKFIDSEISVSLAKTDPVAKEMRQAYQGIEAQLNSLTKGIPTGCWFQAMEVGILLSGPIRRFSTKGDCPVQGNGGRPLHRSCPARKNSWIPPVRSTGILKHWWKHFENA